MKEIYPWQFSTWQIAIASLPSSQSLLLTGEKGIGKLQFAISLAENILCQRKKSDEACGICRSCQLFKSKSHPDYLALGTENKPVNISDIREIISFANYCAHFPNSKKVILIYGAENLNKAAQNALLKTLEEPPANVKILLVTSASFLILPTIRSRCYVLGLSVNKQIAKDWMLKNIGKNIPSNFPEQIAAPLILKHWLDNEELSIRAEVYQNLLSIKQHKLDINKVVSKWVGFPKETLWYWLYLWLLDCLKISLQTNNISNTDYYEELHAISSSMISKEIIKILEDINIFLAGNFKHQNLNQNLALYNLLYKWQSLRKKFKTSYSL